MSKIRVTTKKDEATFEMILLVKRDELRNRIEQHRREMHSEHDTDDEGATALRNVQSELAAANLDRGMHTLCEVEAALRRIETGDYGNCAGCGDRIPNARLYALPWTRVCVKCAEGGVQHTVIPRERVHPRVYTSAEFSGGSEHESDQTNCDQRSVS